jgi:LysR family transcriptional regulator, transcriptional activator for dmlA
MERASDLELFLRVVGRGTVAGAAQELGLSAPAVSKRLAALERRLGVRLLQRTTRRMSVTAEGERYRQQGGRLWAELQELEQDLAGATTLPSGPLRINASLGFGRRHVAPLLVGFARRHPQVQVQLLLTDRPLNLVEHGIDVAIRVGDLPDARLTARRLLANRRVLCAAPDYLARRGMPTSMAALSRHEAIVIRESDDTYGTWQLQSGSRRSAKLSAKVSGTLSSNDGEVAVGWALAGMGILLRSEWDVGHHLRAGRLLAVLPAWSVNADVCAVFATRQPQPAKTRALVDHLVQHFDNAQAAQLQEQTAAAA